MQKYTKQQVLDEKISFKPMTEEQHRKLKAHFGYGSPYIPGYFYRFYRESKSSLSNYGHNRSTYLGEYFISSTKEISFEEFDFEESVDSKPVLPKTFYVLAYEKKDYRNSNYKLIKQLNLLGVKTSKYEGNIPSDGAYLIQNNKITEALVQSEMADHYPKLTLEDLIQLTEFKTLINNEKHEQKTVIAADSGREKHCISRPSGSPRQIELGKRFVGNPISAKTCSTRTISIEIQSNVISF